jgi:hypothetical protein
MTKTQWCVALATSVFCIYLIEAHLEPWVIETACRELINCT